MREGLDYEWWHADEESAQIPGGVSCDASAGSGVKRAVLCAAVDDCCRFKQKRVRSSHMFFESLHIEVNRNFFIERVVLSNI